MQHLAGTSQPGDGRGRSLGFPTANIVLDDPATRPADGIYACFVDFGTPLKRYIGVMHVGPRPTFEASATIEIHILDFPDRDLYSTHFVISVQKKLREVAKFTTVDDLKTAIIQDCQQTVDLLRPN